MADDEDMSLEEIRELFRGDDRITRAARRAALRVILYERPIDESASLLAERLGIEFGEMKQMLLDLRSLQGTPTQNTSETDPA